MTETAAEPVTRLWTKDGFKGDSWRHAAAGDDLSGNSRVILPLADYLALGEAAREAGKDRLGVKLLTAELRNSPADQKKVAQSETLRYSINWPSGLSLGEGQLSSTRTKSSEGDRWEFSLNLEKNIKPGTYTLVITLNDPVGNQSVESSHPFRVE